MTQLIYSKVAAGDDQKIYDAYLFGTIGDELDGNQFARELIYLDTIADEIRLHINSDGGNVSQGMSVVAAIRSISTPVVAYVEGVAASMAAVVAVSCEKVAMCDYAKMMIHNPQFEDASRLTAKMSRQLAKITDMLRTILSSRGQDENRVGALMAAETWLSAAEAMEQGLCDEIITSTRADLKNLAPSDLINQITNSYKPIQEPMTKLTQKAASMLAIATDATEAEISSAVEKIYNDAQAAAKTLKETTARAEKAEAALATIETERKAAQKVEAETLVEAAIKEGRIDASAKADTMAMFELDHTKAKAIVAAIPGRESVSAKIGGTAADASLIDATWDELDKSGKLAELKAKHPDVYAEKFKARFK